MSLRLAYLTGEYPRATDTFIQREVSALRELGHHVQTFSVRRPGGKESGGPETVAERERTCYLLPASPLRLLRAHVSQLFGSPKRYFSAMARALKIRPPGIKATARQLAYFAEAALVARAMAKNSLTHLHNHFADSSCSVATIAAVMGGFSYSFTLHGPMEFAEPTYWRIDEKIRQALFVSCISYFCRSQAMVFSTPTTWVKLHVVHCGVDPLQFEKKTHSGEGRHLLYVGRLAAAKGLPVLLEAVSKLDGVTLTIAGDGPDRADAEELARRLHLEGRTRFLGYQSQSQVRTLLMETDVFVTSSFAEGVPVVLMEAMAAGVPVVAPRIAGIPELVDDGLSGLLVSPGDPAAVVDALRCLLADGQLRNRMARHGRQKVEREFNLHHEARWLETILTSALAGNVVGVRPSG